MNLPESMYEYRPDRYERCNKYLVQVWSDGRWDDDEMFVTRDDMVEYTSDLEHQGIRTQIIDL